MMTNKGISLITNGTKIFLFIFVLGVWFLSCHLSFHAGAMRERTGKNCISASAMSTYEATLEIASTICVDVQTNLVGDIKDQCEKRVRKAEEERDKYLNWYNYAKKQQETTE